MCVTPAFNNVACKNACVCLLVILNLPTLHVFIEQQVWCIWRQKQNKAAQYSARSSPSPPPHVPQQICLYPTAKPSVNSATTIQPEVSQIITQKACGGCGTPTQAGTPTHTPPLKLKATKRLLERWVLIFMFYCLICTLIRQLIV